MKNTALSLLLLMMLGGTWVGTAAAQTDEPEGDTPSEPTDADAPATDETPADAVADTATEGVEAADAVADESADAVEGAADDAAEAGGDAVEVTEAPTEEPVVEQPEVVAEAADALDPPDAAPEEVPSEEEAIPEEAPAEEPEAEPMPWRNTFFNYTNQVTTNSFWRGAQLSYNPLWQMAVSVVPRWYPGTGGFFRANWGMTLELTDTNSNALNREPLLNDLLIDYVHPFMLPEGFILMTMARVTVPVSRSSLAAQRYLQAAGQLTLVKVIPEAGNLTLAVLGRYGYWFAGSNVVQTSTPQPDYCPAAPVTTIGGGLDAPGPQSATCGQFGTATTGRHIILAGISATMTPVGAFSINLSAFLFNSYGHDLAPAYIDVATSAEPLVLEDGSPSHWRNFTYFSLSVAYQFVPWLNLSLGIQNAGSVAPAYDPSGNLYNPIFTPNTQGYLTATITLDELFIELSGQGQEEMTPQERQRRQQGLAAGPTAGGSF